MNEEMYLEKTEPRKPSRGLVSTMITLMKQIGSQPCAVSKIDSLSSDTQLIEASPSGKVTMHFLYGVIHEKGRAPRKVVLFSSIISKYVNRVMKYLSGDYAVDWGFDAE